MEKLIFIKDFLFCYFCCLENIAFSDRTAHRVTLFISLNDTYLYDDILICMICLIKCFLFCFIEIGLEVLHVTILFWSKFCSPKNASTHDKSESLMTLKLSPNNRYT